MLIVDDLADNRALLNRRLLRRNYQIVEAEGGREALAAIENDDFDCVLLDWMMPEMSGDEVLRRIRERFDSSILPVIMVTARDQSEDVVQALKSAPTIMSPSPSTSAWRWRGSRTRWRNGAPNCRCATSTGRCRSPSRIRRDRVAERTQKLRQADAAIQREVALRMASEDRISYLAHYDSLTGLLNRHAFDDKLNEMRERARQYGHQLSLLFIDLDGFKNINDTLGHEAGDELLRQIAFCLTSSLQNGDFVSRFGGDEFAVVHMSADTPALGSASRRDDHRRRQRRTYGCGPSGACRRERRHSLVLRRRQQRLHLAQTGHFAMYRAKADGRGVCRFFEPEMSLKAESRRQLEMVLREAVKRHEFQIYYQPIVDLKSRKVAGFEDCCVRTIQLAALFLQPTLSGLPKRPGSSSRSASGCCARPAPMRRLGPTSCGWRSIFRRSSPRGGLSGIVINALAAAGCRRHRLELEIPPRT